MAHTVASAVAALRVRLDEATAAQWQDADLRQWLDEGIRDIARTTRLHTDQISFAVSANVGEYTLSDRVLAIEFAMWKATADTRKIPLEPRAFVGVQKYINETGSDVTYFSTYGHSPLLKMQLWPTPTRVGTIYIYGPMIPTALDVSGGTGNVDVAEPWYEAALDYAQYLAERKDKQNTQWKDTFGLYQAKVQTMIENSSTDGAAGEIVFTGTSLVPNWLSEFD